ncbi:MAG: SusD/RagB family nutrient-binding outer membrane lipoprotein [Bacteroidota bacterium]|nr:SusD/RagB family nutrient-binding outer membrane lipoprotein [Bacteroidota bacterium]
MKNRFLTYLSIAALTVSSVGCDKYFEDDVVSPNDPEKVTAALLMSNIQVATFASFGGQLTRQAHVMTQQMAGTNAGSQSVEIAQYNITEQTNVNSWRAIYSGTIVNGKILIADFGDGNPWYRGITKVLLAMNFGLATDVWGDVPFTEAGQGLDGNLSPAYNSQEDVISGIQTLLDEAIAELKEPEANNTLIPASDDFIFAGDVDAWLKTAYLLKARYANRLSERDPNYPQSVLDIFTAASNDGAAMTSAADDANMLFGGGNGLNQWYAYEQSRSGYLRAGKTYVDMLNAQNDPRRPFFLTPDSSGTNFSGTAVDDLQNVSSSYVGPYYASSSSPIPLTSYVEWKFIEAEANFRAGNTGPAATAYNDAIIASVEQVTGAAADPAFVTAVASETGASITLEKIMTQKYMALFCQIETWADWRRTGFPALSPNPNGVNNPLVIPVRFIYSQEERQYNTSFPGTKRLNEPVWWDN